MAVINNPPKINTFCDVDDFVALGLVPLVVELVTIVPLVGTLSFLYAVPSVGTTVPF